MKLDRHGLDRLLDMIRQRTITDVVVSAQDRFSRSVVHLLLLLKEIEHNKVNLHLVRDGGKFDFSPASYLKLTILGGAATFEWDNIRIRATDGKRAKIAQGLAIGTGHAAYGYRWQGARRERELIVYEAESIIVREIYTRYDGGESLTAIAENLTNRKIPTWWDGKATKPKTHAPQPGMWTTRQLRKMLRNGAYKGELSQSVGSDTAIISVPAIVDSALWNRVQGRLDVGREQSLRNTRRPYLLRCRITCAVCGRAICGSVGSHDKRRYYRCANRACKYSNTHIDAERLEESVWAWLIEQLNEERIRDALKEREHRRALERERLIAQHDQLMHDRNRLKDEISRLWEQWLAQRMSDEQRDVLCTPRQAQIDAIDGALKTITTAQQSDPKPYHAGILRTVALMREDMAHGNLDYEQQRRMLELMDVRMVVHPTEGWIDVVCTLTAQATRIEGILSTKESDNITLVSRIWLLAA